MIEKLVLIILLIFLVMLLIIAPIAVIQDTRYEALCEGLGYESMEIRGIRSLNEKNNDVYCLDLIETPLFELLEATR